MLQVERCFEYLWEHQTLPYRDVTIATRVPGRGRGIYLREPAETDQVKAFPVQVDPQYRELDPSLNRAKIDLELNCVVTASAPWITVPRYVVLPAAGRMFNVSVDPTGLERGKVHFAYVTGYDAARPDIGPLFRVPVTVVRPEDPVVCSALQEPAATRLPGILCRPGKLHRTFIAVPLTCTWAEFEVTAKAVDGAARMLILHIFQSLPHIPGSKSSKECFMGFATAGTQKHTFRVEPAGTLEVTLVQNWSSLGETLVDLDITFHGVCPDTTTVSLSTDNPVACVHTLSGPGAVLVRPSGSLEIHRSSVRPTAAVIQPGGERELYPEGEHVYLLTLDYPLKLDADAEITPQALPLNDKLYESVFEGQLLLLFDANKRFVTSTDAWPTPVKLKKGEYVARLQVRHPEVALLEKLKTMPLGFDRKSENCASRRLRKTSSEDVLWTLLSGCCSTG